MARLYEMQKVLKKVAPKIWVYLIIVHDGKWVSEIYFKTFFYRGLFVKWPLIILIKDIFSSLNLDRIHYKGCAHVWMIKKVRKKGNRNSKIEPGGIRTHACAWERSILVQKTILRVLYLACLKKFNDVFCIVYHHLG